MGSVGFPTPCKNRASAPTLPRRQARHCKIRASASGRPWRPWLAQGRTSAQGRGRAGRSLGEGASASERRQRGRQRSSGASSLPSAQAAPGRPCARRSWRPEPRASASGDRAPVRAEQGARWPRSSSAAERRKAPARQRPARPRTGSASAARGLRRQRNRAAERQRAEQAGAAAPPAGRAPQQQRTAPDGASELRTQLGHQPARPAAGAASCALAAPQREGSHPARRRPPAPGNAGPTGARAWAVDTPRALSAQFARPPDSRVMFGAMR